MPEWVKLLFDGLGAEILSLIIGIVGGGLFGYRIGKRKNRFIQKQEAGSSSEQNQKGKIVSMPSYGDEKNCDVKSSFLQKQKAGDNSKQTQIGRQNDV